MAPTAENEGRDRGDPSASWVPRLAVWIGGLLLLLPVALWLAIAVFGLSCTTQT